MHFSLNVLVELYELEVNSQSFGRFQHCVVHDRTEVVQNEYQARFVSLSPALGAGALPIYKALRYDAIAGFRMRPRKFLLAYT